MRALLIAILLMASMLASADGMVFRAKVPEPQLTEAPSKIPFQRAVIKFDGKEQIMLIESTINGPAGTYGWVVPLPTRPSYVRSVKPEYIEGTFRSIKPPVQELPKENLPLLTIGAILATTLFLSAGLRYRRYDAAVRVVLYAAEVCAIGLVYYFGFTGGPTAGTAGAATIEDRGMSTAKAADISQNLQVESYGTIGAYEVSVLKGTSADPVMDWLKQHDIQVPDDARSVIDAYAKEGWVFMAAEIRKNEDRALPPHPLKAVFPTDKVIYPMRLTGTQKGSLHLELAIVGKTKARVEGMEEWSCKNDQLLVYVPRDARMDDGVYDDWEGGQYAMAKNGAVVTYLRGDFDPDEMRKDFAIEWQPYERYMAEVYDQDQAHGKAAALGLLWLPGLACLFGAVAIFWPLKARQVAIAGLALAVAGSGAAGGGWFASKKTVETESAYGGYHDFYTPPIHRVR